MEEQKEDGKYFHVENVAKNAVTTIIGIVLMAISAGTVLLSQFVDLPNMKLWVMGVVFIAGFALLFMRDKLGTYIDIFTRKKIE